MKRKTMLKMTTAALALTVVGASTALLVDDQVQASASATFTMDTVAAVRIPSADVENDVSGIRFYAHMDETTRNKAQANGYGFLIFPQRYLSRVSQGEYHSELNDGDDQTQDYIEIEGNSQKFYDEDEDGIWTTQAVVAPVSEVNYNEAFTCVAYINDGNGGYEYATLDETFSRNVLQVASAAYIAEPNNRSALASAYALGTTNPVQIADSEDLERISTAVAGGETFDGVSFKLVNDITIRYDYTPIPETFLGEIDGNNKTVTGSFNADITVSDSVVTNLNKKAKTPDKLVDITIEDDLISNGTASQKRTILSREEWEAEGLLGEYTESALKIYGDELQTTQLKYFLNIPNYNEDEVVQLKETYKYVNFWIAKTEVGTSFGGLYNNDIAFSGSDAFTAKVWKKSTISIEDYFALVEGKTKECIIYTWQSATTSPNAVIYFGDITFSKISVDKSLAKINEKTTIFDVTTVAPKSYLTQTEWQNDGIAGDYTGNAIKFTSSGETNSLTYYLTPPTYTETQIQEIKNNYDYVSFWIALNDAGGTPFQGLWNNIATSTNSNSTFGTRNEWHKFTITVEEYFSYVETNKTASGNVQLIYVYVGTKTNAPNVAIYFGDIEFVPIPTPSDTITEIVQTSSWSETTVGANTTAPIYENDAKSFYKSTDDVVSLAFTGDYTGPAVEFQRGSVTRANFYIARHNLTSKQVNYVISNVYTHVRFYVATENKGTDNPDWYFTAGEGLLQYAEEATDGQYKFTAATDKQWIEFNVPIADFISYVNTAEEGKIELLKRVGSGYWSGTSKKDNFYFYFGEVRFVNVAS